MWESRPRDFHMSTPHADQLPDGALASATAGTSPYTAAGVRYDQRLVRPFVIVEREVGAQPGAGLGHRRVVLQVDLLVLHRPPKPLDEDVVERPAAAVHADLHAGRPQQARERVAGELRTLVGIEYLRPPGRKRPFERIPAELTVQSDRQLPGQHVAAEPLQNRHQIHEARTQSDVGDVATPHLTDALDRNLAQQIRIHAVPGMRLTRPRLRAYRLDAHQPIRRCTRFRFTDHP